MAKNWPAKFYGDGRKPEKHHHQEAYDKPEPYRASDELIRAVNLAIYLGRPLLLEGEAGCGKTRLARAIAYELGLPFYSWPVRSTSKAQDGLFTYDSLLRLHDVQMRQSSDQGQTATNGSLPSRRDPGNPRDYYRLGPLGEAFSLQECSGVVLIDEIDKADLDFPNDLLAVLDDPWSFTLPETDEEITATYTPIMIITSNKEKGNLPFPFLRRCLYHYVEFPSPDILKKIVEKHYEHREEKPPGPLVDAAVDRFQRLRDKGNLHKKPGTSEFLDWIKTLHQFDAVQDQIKILQEEESPTPYPELLYKLRADWPRATPTR